MLPAILTAFLFGFSAVASQRSTRIFGAIEANTLRLGIAAAILGLITLCANAAHDGAMLRSSLFPVLFVSGIIGFGFGDVALFLAYARLGSRLTLLLSYAAATMAGAAGDRLLLGTALSTGQWTAVVAILAGLAIALWPGTRQPVRHPLSGIICGIVSGLGTAAGLVLTGHANELASATGFSPAGTGAAMAWGCSQAFQRISGGLVVALVAMAWIKYRPPVAARKDGPERKWRHRGFWIMSSAIIGPVLGVTCQQWARLTLPSAVVIAVAATSTLIVIPLARLTEKDLPGTRPLAGTLLAAAGVIMLCALRS